MIHSFWENGEYPVFVNPEFDELVLLAKSRWDTIRICVQDNDIGLASGFGNTHESTTKAMRIVLKNKRLLPDTYILFREDGDFWFNLEDHGGPRKGHYHSVVREYFSDDHGNILKDIITNS